jgi:hypothetical protein
MKFFITISLDGSCDFFYFKSKYNIFRFIVCFYIVGLMCLFEMWHAFYYSYINRASSCDCV